MIVTWLLSNWRLVVFTVMLATNAFTYAMWRLDAHKIDQLDYAHAAEIAESARVGKKQEKINEDTTTAWNAAVLATRAYKRVLPAATEAGGLSRPAIRVDGTNPDAIPAAANVAEDCAFTTLTANQLQDWVSKQQEATK